MRVFFCEREEEYVLSNVLFVNYIRSIDVSNAIEKVGCKRLEDYVLKTCQTRVLYNVMKSLWITT